MNWIKETPPKGKDFIIIGSNGKKMIGQWYKCMNGMWTITTNSQKDLHWDKVDWMPLPKGPNE